MGWFVAYYVPKAWAASDPDTIRRSGYLSMLEGRMGHIRTQEEHDAYVAEMASKKLTCGLLDIPVPVMTARRVLRTGNSNSVWNIMA
jgi:hypothetical protein